MSKILEKPKWLLIDDMRSIRGIDRTARSYDEAVKAITFEGPWDTIMFDHDLGEERTGYDIMCILEREPKLIPNNILIITQNSAARPRMEQLRLRLLDMKNSIQTILS